MTPILFIAYQYPPMSGPGVHRSFRLSKELPSLGYKPYVVTIHEDEIKQQDRGLLDFIPKEVEILRTPAYKTDRFKRFFQKLRLYRVIWFLFYPLLWDSSLFWNFRVYKQVSEWAIENNISIVYTSSGPFSNLILGYLLQKRLKMKWVADLRDPFTDAYAWTFPGKFQWLLARLFEKKILAKPDMLVVNTEQVRNLYIERGLQHPDKIVCINSGF